MLNFLSKINPLGATLNSSLLTNLLDKILFSAPLIICNLNSWIKNINKIIKKLYLQNISDF